MNNPCFGYNFNSLEYCVSVEPCFDRSAHLSLDSSKSFQKEWRNVMKSAKLNGEYTLENFIAMFDNGVILVFDGYGNSVYDSKDCYNKVVLCRYDVARFEIDRLTYILSLNWRFK